MLQQLLPQRIDNTYRGQKLALWLFGSVLLLRAGISLASMFNGHHAASSADGIPLDTFTPAGTQAVLSLFALLGLSRLMLCLVGILALVRYRGMVPLLFALLTLEQLGRQLVLQLLPIVRVGAAPGVGINVGLLVLMAVGLALSLWTRSGVRAEE